MNEAIYWYKDVVLNKYAQFNGRARRAEFWWFALVNLIISIVLSVIDNILGTDSGAGSGLFGGLYSLAVLVPSLAVGARRLHDTNRSGWWQLLWFAIIVGWIVLLIWYVQDSDEGDNKYGPNPKAAGGYSPATA